MMAVILLLYGASQILWGEKTPFNGGTGYDGKIYTAIAQDFGNQVAGHQLRGYYVQRILPPTIVHFALRASGQPLSTAAIIRGFEIMNLLCLLLAVMFWRSIGDALQLSLRSRWLGFVALFVNYFCLKQTFYNPVLTDAFAFALGLAMFSCFLNGRRLLLLICTLAASFAWPVAIYSGAALLIWPRRPVMEEPAERPALGTWLAVGAVAVASVLIGYIYFLKEKQWGLTVQELVIPSALLVLLYLFTSIRTLFEGLSFRSVGDSLRSIEWPNLALGAGVFLATRLVVRSMAAPTGEPPWAEAKQFLLMITLLPLQKPGTFVVAPIVYVGPIVILMMVYFPALAAEIRRYGVGVMLSVLLTLLVSLTGETRQTMLVYPWLVAIFIRLSERFMWPTRVYWVIAALSLLMSKVWLHINPQSPVYVKGEEWDFPRQWELMQYGPWMSPLTLAIQAAAVVMVILVFQALRMGPPGTLRPFSRLPQR